MLSTSQFLHTWSAIGSKVSWPSLLAVGGSLAAGLGIFNNSRLTSAKEVIQKDMEGIQKDIQKDMESKRQELKHGLEKLTEQVVELNNSQQPRTK